VDGGDLVVDGGDLAVDGGDLAVDGVLVPGGYDLQGICH
jgi:hypothetical protein